MSKMKKIFISVIVILTIAFLAWGITKVFAGEEYEVYLYRCNAQCMTYNGTKYYAFFSSTEKLEGTITCPNCGKNDIMLRGEKAVKYTYISKLTGRTNKLAKTFLTTYECEKGHICTATGSNYNRYKWKIGEIQTDLTSCPYANCGAKLTKIDKQNITHVRGMEQAAIFDNIYCVASGQQMDLFIQTKGALYEAITKVEIKGNIAKIYEYSDVENKYIYKATKKDSLNNTMAAILASKEIEKGHADNYDAREQYIYEKNGAKHQEAQLLIYNYWNSWVKALGEDENGDGTKDNFYGLEECAGNLRTSLQRLVNGQDPSTGTQKGENLITKLETVKAGEKEYSATIYFLKYNNKYNFLESYVYDYTEYTPSSEDDTDLSYYTMYLENNKAVPGTAKYDGKTEEWYEDNNGEMLYKDLQELILVDIPVYVTKDWKDNENSLGKRPDSITVELYADNKATGKTLTLTGPDWTGKFEELDRTDSTGKIIEYTVKEIGTPEGYTSETTGNQYEGYTITNTIIPETPKTQVKVIKEWSDEEDANGFRPDEITVILKAHGTEIAEKTLTAPSWEATFENLEKYAPDGEKLTYVVEEVNVENYTTTYTRTEDEDIITYTIENTAVDATEVAVKKDWEDQDDREGIRPISITVELYADDKATEKTLTLTGPYWTGKFENLPKTKDGEEIIYTVKEVDVPEGYTSKITGDQYEGYTITNTHIPEGTEIEVIKKWEDDGNSEGLRPTEIRVRLYKNGESAEDMVTYLKADNNWTAKFTDLFKYENGKEITYTVKEENVPEGYISTEIGNKDNNYTITNKREPTTTTIKVIKVWDDNNNAEGFRPESINVTLYKGDEENPIDIEKAELNSANNWEKIFTGLPEYENGKQIEYKIREDAVEGYPNPIYSKTIDEQTGVTILKVTNMRNQSTVKVNVIKKWEDNNNSEGLRPSEIEVILYANYAGKKEELRKVTLTVPENSSESLTYTFENLPKYLEGEEVVYTVEETPIANYEAPQYEITEESEDGRTFTITNKRIPTTTKVKVQKGWDDDDNRDGIRPTEIKVNLKANGTIKEEITLKAENDWKWESGELPDYIDGKLTTYTIEEIAIDGYQSIYSEPEITEDGTIFTITNKHIPERIHIKAKKVWNDENNIEGFRPTSILVELYKDGMATGDRRVLQPNAWTAVFSNLLKYENGVEIEYEVREVNLPEKYTSSEAGTKSNNYTITNTRIPEKVNVKVEKVWDDKNNLQEIRPESITVELYANTTLKDTVILNQENNWKHTFEDLYKYENAQQINYKIREVGTPEGYISKIERNQTTEFIIRNTAEINYPGYIEISGKVWLDKRDGKGNDINGILDDHESGLKGIRVILRDETGKQFDKTSTAITDGNGNYIIRVNYDNSNAVYKLYENAETVQEELKTAYIEFQYNGMKYTTVANATTGALTSKAIENETLRNSFDKAFTKVTQGTEPTTWDRSLIYATTQDVISFENYADRTAIDREEILKICTGHGTYILSNSKYPWDDVKTGNCNEINHPEICTGEQHSIGSDTVEVTKILNVNLGLFEREQPDVAIFSDLSSVQVMMDDEEYTYLYGVRGPELEAKGGLNVKFQNNDAKEYTYRRPVNPADIAYLNSEAAEGKEMVVKVTYQVKIGNLSTTLPIKVHDIANWFDSRYTLTTSGWTQSSEDGFNKATNNKDLNITVQPGMQSNAIELTYTVSLEAIKALLNEDATLNHAVEIQSYSTYYGEKTLYAEQRPVEKPGGRAGSAYGGYDINSHPGNAGIFINGEGKLEAAKLEDDTDIAPSFVLCKDENYYKVLSGNVWEDSDANIGDNYRIGDGKKSDSEKNVANVKVELYKVNDDGSLEIAKLYSNGSEVKTKDAITYTDANGYYAFGDENCSVPTDTYVIKFTYGTGIDGSKASVINSANISARDYKSTIISSENKSVYDLYKGIDNDEWHLKTSKGYSIAVDTLEERQTIADLQYSNYNDNINITAWSKPFTMQLEFDPNIGKTSKVEAGGFTIYSNELDIFDFGIIERAREDIFVETTMDYMKITLANGQVLTEGNPGTDKMNYAKPVGFNQIISTGTATKLALEKQVVVEMDTELMQGAKLETRYQITVTNNSEIDIEYYVNDEYKTEFYYFGTNNEGSPAVEDSVNQVVAYLDSELVYTEKDLTDKDWNKVSAQNLKDKGLISNATFGVLKNNGYIMYITDNASNLKTGESIKTTVNASKILANQDENVYDIQAEILEVDTKTARTTSSKQYKMGNYVPSLTTRKISTNINNERAGLHEQDDDRLKIILTPPTGLATYIITYLVIGVVGLVIIATVVIFIKKKVLTK